MRVHNEKDQEFGPDRSLPPPGGFTSNNTNNAGRKAARALLFSTDGFSTLDSDLFFFGLDFRLSLQLLDSRTTPDYHGLRGQIHPEIKSKNFYLLSFLLSRTTFGRMAEVQNKGLSRGSDRKVWRSDITVENVRLVD